MVTVPHVVLIISYLPSFSTSSPTHDTSSSSQHLPEFQGWTEQPDGRGTIDILWSCLFTIFLCSWAVLCLNVPATADTYWRLIWRKFCLTGLGVLGPEFILQSALGQWISARRSLKDFHASDFGEWTMTHAFFADMGGFVLHTTDWVPFPINSKQLHYLVVHGYLPLPSMSKREIKDRNKVDTLLRIITVLQTIWFVTNCLGRVAQSLAVTTFELTTIGFIFCTLGTHLCWAHKPADVDVPVVLFCKTPITRILLEAGNDASRPYSQTPLDFISRKEWSWSLWWHLMLNTLRKVGIRFRPKVRPVTRIPNDDWPEIPAAGVFVLACVDMAYAAIYMAGWNFRFATSTERMLWRVSTSTILGVIVAYLVVESYAFWVLPALPHKVRRMLSSSRTRPTIEHSSGFRAFISWLRNSSQRKDEQLYIPLKAAIPITLAGIVYLFARSYILLECFLALRKLPSSAYRTVEWSMILPHV